MKVCACGCERILPNQLRKFLRGHNLSIISEKWRDSRRANITKWNTSEEGRAFNRKAGKELGIKYGKDNSRNIRSTPHEHMLANKLKTWNINYEWNTKVVSKGGKTRYRIDFYLPKWNIALEVDGDTHILSRIRQRDQIRDRYLADNHGIRTVRIKNEEVDHLTKSKLRSYIYEDSIKH